MSKKDENKTIRSKVRKIQRGGKASSRDSLVIGGLTVLFIGIVVGLLYISRPAATVSAMGNVVSVGASDHVPEGSDPGPYPSDPPAGGKHYASTYDAGFYDEEKVKTLPGFHEGYLVHNLEHGYIIYYYNCQVDPGTACADLKNSIQAVQAQANNIKTIAFPWPTLDSPIVMASWGRIMPLKTLDQDLMRQFYLANLNKAPEPDAE